MRTLIALLLIALTATPTWAQAPPTPSPCPSLTTTDAAYLCSHLLYIEGRIEALSTQVHEAHVAEQRQLTEIHELIIVEAAKPNAAETVVGLFTNRTFWEFAVGFATSIYLLVQQRAKD